MSVKNAMAFLQKAEADATLGNKLGALHSNAAAIVKLAGGVGFSFSEDDLLTAQDELYGELSDDELSGAAGGTIGIKQDVPKNP